MMPALTLGNIVAVIVGSLGAFLFQWGMRKGWADDIAYGVVLIILAYAITKVGPLL